MRSCACMAAFASVMMTVYVSATSPVAGSGAFDHSPAMKKGRPFFCCDRTAVPVPSPTRLLRLPEVGRRHEAPLPLEDFHGQLPSLSDRALFSG